MLGRWFFLAVVGIGLIAIVKAPHSGGARATITQTCATPGIVSAAFTWAAPPAGTSQVWLDLSTVDGLPPALTTGHGPLAAAQRSYSVDGLPVNIKLYYRINAQVPAGWQAVAQGALTTACPGAPAPAAAHRSAINVGDVIAVATVAAKVR